VSGPRVRFAPSPTGFFHVGSARSALFNWFVARQDPDGVFILRIEDTDTERNREEWVLGIVSAINWLGMSPDEGPYRQSDNVAAHAEALRSLMDAGYLYFCDCTGDAVAQRKGDDKTPGYDGFCRDRALSASPTTAYRFRTPDGGEIVVKDDIRGDVTFSHEVIDDFVVAKPSGAVLFALANVVDDRADRITHVIRGEEHLPNTPRQMLLWKALDGASGLEVAIPHYAHLPVLVNEQRKKLSKRRDPVAVEMYRDQGYLSEAFVNYLALLGWSPRGDVEIVNVATCVEQFRLSDVSHSPAFFDVKKLAHMNGEYIRSLSREEFVERCAPWTTPWRSAWPSESAPPWSESQFDPNRFTQIAPLVQERVALLSEVPAMVDFLFLDEPTFDEAAFDKSIRNDELARTLLAQAISSFGEVDWTSESLHHCTVSLGESLGLNLRKAQAPIRCAITGRLVGPPLFESLELLGREEVLSRISGALARAVT
jgi:glutamyl-tRNA synthetase